MRKAPAILLCLTLLASALLPALPAYVCAGMDGAHRLHPCCPAPAETASGPSIGTTRCCHPIQPAAREAPVAPASVRPLLPAVAFVAVLPGPRPGALARPASSLARPRAHSPPSLPPDRKRVLRI